MRNSDIIGLIVIAYQNHLFASLFAVHETLWNDIGRKQFIALAEFLEWNAIGEALAANADAFQDTVTAELVQNQRGVDLAGALLVIRNDAANKVGVRVAQRGHQLG